MTAKPPGSRDKITPTTKKGERRGDLMDGSLSKERINERDDKGG